MTTTSAAAAATPDEPSTIAPTLRDPRAELRWMVYILLICITGGQMLGRIFAVNAVDTIQIEKYLQGQGRKDWQKQRPFLSGNDRSRWCTVRALVEQGTYQIDDIVQLPNWDTIDMVKHDGHLYSSKPPLLPTIMAGEYWLVRAATGWTLGENTFEVVRTIVIINQWLPLLVYFFLLARLAERYGQGDFDRIFVVAAGCFATLLPTFVTVINNHLPAAMCVLFATYAALRILIDGERRWHYFAIAGFFAAFAAANELPALSFVGLLGLVLLLRAPWPTLYSGVPAVLLVVIASFGTNYLAHGTLTPAYAMRTEGENWYHYEYQRGSRTIKSYWYPENLKGIDKGEPRRDVYALHVLVGHHGIFSLTPIWLLAFVGMGMLAARRSHPLSGLAWMTIILTVVVVGFYLARPLIDRNYGGTSSGLRWLFWLAPLWLLVSLPAAEYLGRRRSGQVVAGVLLALSAISTTYPTWNPWTHPWLMNWMTYLGWVNYS